MIYIKWKQISAVKKMLKENKTSATLTCICVHHRDTDKYRQTGKQPMCASHRSEIKIKELLSEICCLW